MTPPSLRISSWRVQQKWFLLLGIVLVLSTLLVVTVALRQFRQGKNPTVDLRGARVAVLPLENQSLDPEATGLVLEGIGSSLATHLTRVLGSAVVPWVTSRRFAEEVGEVSQLRKVAQVLRVQALILGTFRMSGDRVRVHLALMDTSTGKESWSDEFEGSFSDIFDLEASIAIRTATQLKGQLTGDDRDELRQPLARDPEAYRAYLEGQRHLNGDSKEAFEAAFQRFATAVELDPDFAEAHVGLGTVHMQRCFMGWGGREDLDQAEAHFKRALINKPGFQAARGGLVRVFWERGKSEECLKLGVEARRTGGEDVETLFVRGEAYVFGGLGDLAIPLFERILELDPASQGARWFLVLCSWWGNRFEATVELGIRYLQEYGPDADVLIEVGASKHHLGDPQQAMHYYRQGFGVATGYLESMTLRFASLAARDMGDLKLERAFLLEALRLVQPLAAAHPDNSRLRFELAWISGALGDRQRLWEEAKGFLSGETDPTDDSLGEVFAHLGQYERAVEFWRYQVRSGNYKMYTVSMARLMAGSRVLEQPEIAEALADYERFGQRLRKQYGEAAPQSAP